MSVVPDAHTPGAFVGVLVAAALVLMLDGCGSGQGHRQAASAAHLSADPALPSGVVARAAGTTITQAQFDRLYRSRAASLKRPGAGASRIRAALASSVMTTLIEQAWIGAQARQEGVTVSDREVSGSAARLRLTLGRLLSRTGAHAAISTEALRAEVRAQLLERALYRKNAGIGHQGALRAHTLCRPGYVVALCANARIGGGS